MRVSIVWQEGICHYFTETVLQYTKGVALDMYSVPAEFPLEVCISNEKDYTNNAVVYLVNDYTINIPDEFFHYGANVYLWFFGADDNAYMITIPVAARPVPVSGTLPGAPDSQEENPEEPEPDNGEEEDTGET